MYTKASAPTIVDITLAFKPELNADPFIFPLKRTTRKEKDTQDQLSAIGIAVDPVDWLADMLVEPPKGFPDFPLTEAEKVKALALEPNGNGPQFYHMPEYKAVVEETPTVDKALAERVRMYFLDKDHLELIDMAAWVKERYFRTVLPSFLF